MLLKNFCAKVLSQYGRPFFKDLRIISPFLRFTRGQTRKNNVACDLALIQKFSFLPTVWQGHSCFVCHGHIVRYSTSWRTLF